MAGAVAVLHPAFFIEAAGIAHQPKSHVFAAGVQVGGRKALQIARVHVEGVGPVRMVPGLILGEVHGHAQGARLACILCGIEQPLAAVLAALGQ